MDLIVSVPESPEVPASEVLTLAARRAGHTAEHTATAAEYLAAHLAEYLHTLYRSARVDEELARVETSVPPPDSPALRTRTATIKEGDPQEIRTR